MDVPGVKAKPQHLAVVNITVTDYCRTVSDIIKLFVATGGGVVEYLNHIPVRCIPTSEQRK